MYQKLEELGDFRRGTLSVNYRKCGRKNCVCAKPRHPGHRPQYLWNMTIMGKSLSPELEKYRKEMDHYRDFVRLCGEVVGLNERICDGRPPYALNK